MTGFHHFLDSVLLSVFFEDDELAPAAAGSTLPSFLRGLTCRGVHRSQRVWLQSGHCAYNVHTLGHLRGISPAGASGHLQQSHEFASTMRAAMDVATRSLTVGDSLLMLESMKAHATRAERMEISLARKKSAEDRERCEMDEGSKRAFSSEGGGVLLKKK